MRGRWHPSLGREPNDDELDRLMGLDVERIEFEEVPVKIQSRWFDRSHLSAEERALLGDYGPLNWRPDGL